MSRQPLTMPTAAARGKASETRVALSDRVMEIVKNNPPPPGRERGGQVRGGEAGAGLERPGGRRERGQEAEQGRGRLGAVDGRVGGARGARA